jgi:CheY-like chemotaxis protein
MDVKSVNHRRILVVDDNQAIHDDFLKVLATEDGVDALDEDEANLFGGAGVAQHAEQFEIDSAHQGGEAIDMVHEALASERPYSVAFVDVRMPPGMDGVETIGKLWDLDPFLQIVICTAYSDYSWHEMIEKLGSSDRLLILKKPFDIIEVRQLAEALTEKWRLSVKQWIDVQTIQNLCRDKTHELHKTQTALTSVRATMDETIWLNSEPLPTACDEIRAKLQTVASGAERLLDSTLPGSERRAVIDAIAQDATQGLSIIDYMLDASRSQAYGAEVESA